MYVQKEIIQDYLIALLIKLMENGIGQNNFNYFYWLLLANEESADLVMQKLMNMISKKVIYNDLYLRKEDFILGCKYLEFNWKSN